MAEYLEVAQARELPGLRLVLTAGVPGPWGESAKGIFHVKKIPFVRVRQVPGTPNAELEGWTRQTNAPVAMFEDERPRSGWAEILLLAERLAPEPALLPGAADERARVFGYAHEICGEMGFGWCRRLMLLHDVLASDAPPASRAIAENLGRKYGYEPRAAEAAPGRAAEILRMLAARLRKQRSAGSPFFVGPSLTALDIYWAAFAALVEPLPAERCPMPGLLRATYTSRNPGLREAADPILLEHRDFVYERYLELPVDL